MVINNLKTVYEQNIDNANLAYVRNVLKEVVQNYVLNFIYNSKEYKDLIFTGGTCLRKFYNLNRLSEDLDFDYEGELDLEKLQNDLKDYFTKKLGVKNVSFKVKNYTIFMKLPILREVGFAGPNDSEILMVRIDFAAKRPSKPETEYKEFIYNGFSFIGRLYNFKSLFLNKTDAFLNRVFKRGDEQKTDFKGRDAFDMNFLTSLLLVLTILTFPSSALAQRVTVSPSPEPTTVASPEATELPRIDITQKTEEVIGPLETLIRAQEINNVWPFNPIKHAIKNAVESGVPANTIVLLLLLPIVATVMAASRQIVGIRGFGIFLPAALSIAFVAIGPILGILLFMAIVVISTSVRLITRKLKLKLQYLPRMALILWFVSFGILGILFASPMINYPALKNVSIFPVLVLTLLTEDFTRIQLGKSFKTAIGLTNQTLILAFISYAFLTYQPFRTLVLLNPEIALLVTFVINIVLGKYVGLRFMEYLRFRKLIKLK